MDFTKLEYWDKGFERMVFLKNDERITYRYEFIYHECRNMLTIKCVRKHFLKEKFFETTRIIEKIHKTVRFYNKEYEMFEVD
jgi:hypothetical protein